MGVILLQLMLYLLMKTCIVKAGDDISEICSVVHNDTEFCELGAYETNNTLLSSLKYKEYKEYIVLNASHNSRIYMIRWGYISEKASPSPLNKYDVENNVFIEAFMDDSSRNDGLYSNEFTVQNWQIDGEEIPFNIFPDSQSYISCNTVYLEGDDYIRKISFDLDVNGALIGLQFISSKSVINTCPPSKSVNNSWQYTYDGGNNYWMLNGFSFKVWAKEQIFSDLSTTSGVKKEPYIKHGIFAGFESIQFGYSCNPPCFDSKDDVRYYNAEYFTVINDNNMEYLVYNQQYKMNFYTAQSICESIGSSLATIHEFNKDSIFLLNDGIWLGAKSHDFWIDGTPILESSLQIVTIDRSNTGCAVLTGSTLQYKDCNLLNPFYCNNLSAQNNRIFSWIRVCDKWKSDNHRDAQLSIILKAERKASPIFFINNNNMLLPSDDGSNKEEDKWSLYDLSSILENKTTSIESEFGRLIQFQIQMDRAEKDRWNIFESDSLDFCINGMVLQFGDKIYSRTASINGGVILSTKCTAPWLLHINEPYLQCIDNLFTFSAVSNDSAQYKVSIHLCPQSSSGISADSIKDIKMSLTGKSYLEGVWRSTDQIPLQYPYTQPLLSKVLTSVSSTNVFLSGDLLPGTDLTKYIIRGSEFRGSLNAPEKYAFSPPSNGQILGYHLSYKGSVRLTAKNVIKERSGTENYDDLLYPIIYKMNYYAANQFGYTDDGWESLISTIAEQETFSENVWEATGTASYMFTEDINGTLVNSTGSRTIYNKTTRNVQKDTFLAPDDAFRSSYYYKHYTSYITNQDDEIYVIFDKAVDVLKSDKFMIAMVLSELSHPWYSWFWSDSCDPSIAGTSCPKKEDETYYKGWDEYLVAASVFDYATTGPTATISFIYQNGDNVRNTYSKYDDKPFVMQQTANGSSWNEAGSNCNSNDKFSDLASMTNSKDMVWAHLEIASESGTARTEKIRIRADNHYVKVYDDYYDERRDSGALSFWKPDVFPAEYYITMPVKADYDTREENPDFSTILLSGPADAFANPGSYSSVYVEYDAASTVGNAARYQPIAKTDYVCFGDVVMEYLAMTRCNDIDGWKHGDCKDGGDHIACCPYPGTNNNVCTKLLKDYINVRWCPKECKKGEFKDKGSCHYRNGNGKFPGVWIKKNRFPSTPIGIDGYKCINKKYLEIDNNAERLDEVDGRKSDDYDDLYQRYMLIEFANSTTSYNIPIFTYTEDSKKYDEDNGAYYKFKSHLITYHDEGRDDSYFPWIGLRKSSNTEKWGWIDESLLDSDSITMEQVVLNAGDCSTLSDGLISTSTQSTFYADDCENKRAYLCEISDNGDWNNDEEKSFLVTVPPNTFDEVILVSFENTGDNAICIDEVTVNTESSTFISSNWIANTDNSDDECITHSCEQTSFAIMKYPVCEIKVIDTRYNFEDDSEWEETSNLTAAVSECKNYNRLSFAGCEVSQSITVTDVVSTEISDSFSYSEAQSSGTSQGFEKSDSTSESWSVGSETAFITGDGSKGPYMEQHVTGEYGQEWSYGTSRTEERWSESSYEYSQESSTTNSWSQENAHDVTCTASIDVPPSHKQTYSLLTNRYRGIVPSSMDLKLTLCSAYIDPADSSNPGHYRYIYNVPSQQFISSITKCVVQFDKPSVLLNQLTCDQEQELSFLSGYDYMPTCNDTNPIKYDGCQCQIIDTLTSAVCSCADPEGNLLNNNAAIVVERDDWRDVCRYDLDCPNSKWNLPTNAPTNAPTKVPTLAPTNAPTYSPTNAPSLAPTNSPTDCIHDLRSFKMVAPSNGNWEGFTVSGNCFHSNYFNYYINNIHPQEFSPDQFTLGITLNTLSTNTGLQWSFSSINPSIDTFNVDIIENNNILLDNNVFPTLSYVMFVETDDIEKKVDTTMDIKAHIFHMGYNAFMKTDNDNTYCCDAFNELFNGITFEIKITNFPFRVNDDSLSISFEFNLYTFWNSHLKSNIDAGNPSQQDNGIKSYELNDHYTDLFYLYLPTFVYIDGEDESNKQPVKSIDIQHSDKNDGASMIIITFPRFNQFLRFGDIITQKTINDIPLYNHPLNNKINYGKTQPLIQDIYIDHNDIHNNKLIIISAVIIVVLFIIISILIFICIKKGYHSVGYKVVAYNDDTYTETDNDHV